LRGAGEEGITRSRASERTVAADPDTTGLFDRLEARKLIQNECHRKYQYDDPAHRSENQIS
jgi:hypothetical protein